MSNTKENSAAKGFIYSSAFWLAVGVSIAIIIAVKMAYPDFLKGHGWLQFGRLRPVHVNAVLLGWLSMAYVGVMFYITPRLTRCPLYSEKLGLLTMWLWNLTVVIGAVSLLAGITQGKELLELFWLPDLMVLACLILVAINILKTIANRTEDQLYVSLWYFIGSVFWLPLVWTIGNFDPFSGVNDANANWFYGHNVIGLWFTTVGVGMVYYFVPIITRNPLYSHRLSLIGFWTIAFIYVWVGAHHIIAGPIPEWLQTVAIIFSIGMLIPVWTVVANFFKTMSGKWGVMADSIPLKFIVYGSWCYFLTCLQGPFQALRTVNQYTHLTNWTVGHAHLALFGSFSFITWGAIYYILPKMLNNMDWFSTRLANWHFWLSAIGFAGFFLDLTAAGLIQGAIWIHGQSFIDGVKAMKPYMIGRVGFGGMMMSAQFLFAYNLFRTIKR